MIWCAVYDVPTLLDVFAYVRLWGLNEALSGTYDSVATYRLLGNALIDIYLLCAAVLAVLRARRGRPVGVLATHLLGFSSWIVYARSLTRAWSLLVTLGVVAIVAGAALSAWRRPQGPGGAEGCGRALGDVSALALVLMSGAYLYSACCMVANEFYASALAQLAVWWGYPVGRGWVAVRLASLVVASAAMLLVGLGHLCDQGGCGGLPLRAAGCAVLVALSCHGIAEHYLFYTFPVTPHFPRTQLIVICLCVLYLIGSALGRAGSRAEGEASRAAPEGEAG